MIDLAYVVCIESGVLEQQSLLLFESIRSYTGAYADASIYAYSPRRGRDVSDFAKREMNRLGVVHINDELNTHGLEYGTINRIVAGSHAERTFAHDVFCVIDSDTFFTGPPESFELARKFDMLARPVDLKGRASSGPDDRYDAYLRAICRLCGVHYDDVPFVTSTIDRAQVKASYNGGLVLVRSDAEILQRTEEFFLKSVRENLIIEPEAAALRTGTGTVSSEQSRWWGSSQIALSLAAWSSTKRVRHLPPTYNYPMHLHRRAADEFRRSVWPTAKHIHYHWLLHVKPEDDCPLLHDDSPLTTAQKTWIVDNTKIKAP